MPDHTCQIACACGAARFEATHPPLFRAICHCGICQRFNKAEYADITIHLKTNINVKDDTTVAYAAHKNPPLVLRGTCAKCKSPAIEKLRIPFMPGLVIVPSRLMDASRALPAPKLHIFYEDRVRDADDNLPKHSGYLRSQTAFSMALVRALLRNRG